MPLMLRLPAPSRACAGAHGGVIAAAAQGMRALDAGAQCGRTPPPLPTHTRTCPRAEACLSLGFHCALELLEAQQELEAQREPTASPPAPAEQQAPPASRLRKRGAAGAAQPSDTGRQQPVQAQAPAGAAAAGRAAASLYSEQELAAAIQAVTVVRFGQRIQLPGSDVEAVAAPSGAGIGTCCWLLETGGRRCVLPGSSPAVKPCRQLRALLLGASRRGRAGWPAMRSWVPASCRCAATVPCCNQAGS